MRVREGLSFSDYFDDSVPADVKAPQMLCPMEESNEETDVDKFTFGVSVGVAWMDKHGKYFYDGSSHSAIAVRHLESLGVNPYSSPNDVYAQMYNLGFIKIYIHKAEKRMDITYHNKPTIYQLRQIKNDCIEHGWSLEDSVTHKDKDLDEESIRQDAPQSDYPTTTKDEFKGLWEETLFIESMMPNDMETFKTHLVQLFAYLQKELQLKTVPDVKLISDDKNADKVLGKTAYYDPNKKIVVIYTTNRHQKDILRSFAHEIIHHWQHENGKLSDKKASTKDPQYAQKDPWMRQMEKQAYLLGNILFRDWEDNKKAKDRESV